MEDTFHCCGRSFTDCKKIRENQIFYRKNLANKTINQNLTHKLLNVCDERRNCVFLYRCFTKTSYILIRQKCPLHKTN